MFLLTLKPIWSFKKLPGGTAQRNEKKKKKASLSVGEGGYRCGNAAAWENISPGVILLKPYFIVTEKSWKTAGGRRPLLTMELHLG